MSIDVSSNAREVAKRLDSLAKSCPVTAKKGLTDATSIFYKGSRGRLSSLIYNQPIPKITRKRSGRSVPAWRRTSQLLRGERADYSNLENFETTIDNNTPYAAARHALNRRSPVDGKTRRAPWRDLTRKADRRAAVAAFRAAFAALLSR